MGLCKCPKRKVTNLFCFEHDVNVCEDCLVSDHERCIVQSYVQWLQDSDYNPICILCKNLLKDELTVRLACYDVFHWACLDKYASGLPVNTAPAGYQCPKCKEGIFPPSNIVSPVVDALRSKLETVKWSRVALGHPILGEKINKDSESELSFKEEKDVQENKFLNGLEDESNDFVIVTEQNKQIKTNDKSAEAPDNKTYQEKNLANNENDTNIFLKQNRSLHNKSDLFQSEENKLSHNRTLISDTHDVRRNTEPSYDPSLGIVLNINNLEDRDTGEFKYQRRPLFEWFNRWLKSRQMSTKVRMTRQKKYMFIIMIVFIVFLTLILFMSRLGAMNTENDPAFEPLNNPNIHVE